MELLEELVVEGSDGRERRICLFHGDLTQIPAEEAVDVLVVSAFPGDYTRTTHSLIGALDRDLGISVRRLAQHKMLDLTEHFSCWISKSVARRSAKFGFRHILCFEPLRKTSAPSRAVGDVFRSLIPALFEYECRETHAAASIAMPLVATGDQGNDATAIMKAILESGVNWLRKAAPVEKIKIVERDATKAMLVRRAFRTFKSRLRTTPSARRAPSKATGRPAKPPVKKFDVFISYSHKDHRPARALAQRLEKAGLKVFIDRNSIDVGRSWQQEIFESLDETRKVVTLYSPDYFSSAVCKEEFNVAYALERQNKGVLVPLYLRSTQLATYIELIKYIDAREGDSAKVSTVWPRLLQACR